MSLTQEDKEWIKANVRTHTSRPGLYFMVICVFLHCCDDVHVSKNRGGQISVMEGTNTLITVEEPRL